MIKIKATIVCGDCGNKTNIDYTNTSNSIACNKCGKIILKEER